MPVRVTCLAALAVLPMSAYAQGSRRHVADADSIRRAAALAARSIVATRISGRPPTIDGALDDRAWSTAAVATDFVEAGPHPGILPAYRTEFRVLFDEKAIYFGVRAFDPAPSTIVAPYPRRDYETRSDWIFVEIDSRHDRRTGFGFGINPRGVQVDATFNAVIDYDYAWDAVWQGASRIDSLGWTAEYRIPFSQLAYSAAPGQSMAFGLNVYRATVRGGESSDWSPRLPTYAELESHFNTITGLVAPVHPEQLEVVPYVAAKGSVTPSNGNPLIVHSQETTAAGVDLRLRLPGGLTATAAVRPDFGQVEADPSQVNLTTFESYFPEQRPFFVEGESQFAFDAGLPFTSRGNSFANEQPFYSRRIGAAPQGAVPASARFSDIASSTPLLGAFKLSGRTSNGWSGGAMTAVTGRSNAAYIDGDGTTRHALVEPATGFDVVRLSRASANGGSTIGLIGTAVIREHMDSALATIRPADAFAVGIDGRHRFGHENYEVSGFAIASRVSGSAQSIERIVHGPGHFAQRPDAGYLHDDTTRTATAGGSGELRLAKLGGNWHWSATGHVITPGFDVNDAGFQRNADWLLAVGSLGYVRYRPGHWLRRWAAGVNQIGAGWDFGGDRRAAVVSSYLKYSLRNYWSGSVSAGHEFQAYSTDILRGGPAFLLPATSSVAATIATDSRRPMQLTFAGSAQWEPGSGSRRWDFGPAFAWRATDRLALALGPDLSHEINGWQYVAQSAASGPGVAHYLVGRLDQRSASVIARADLAFGPTMTLQLYAQPFLSAGRYTGFQEVVAPRAPRASDRLLPIPAARLTYDTATSEYRADLGGVSSGGVTFANPDFNQQAFNLNLVWRWEYRPGSTVYLVWTQRRDGVGQDGSLAIGRNLTDLLQRPATNVMLVKVSYRTD